MKAKLVKEALGVFKEKSLDDIGPEGIDNAILQYAYKNDKESFLYLIKKYGIHNSPIIALTFNQRNEIVDDWFTSFIRNYMAYEDQGDDKVSRFVNNVNI